MQYSGHKYYLHPIHRAIQQRRQFASGNIFVYYLGTNHAPEFEFCRRFWSYCGVSGKIGTNHTDDLALLFKQSYDRRPDESYKCWSAFPKFLSAITNFASSGQPGHGWQPFTTAKNCLNIGTETWEMQLRPYEREMLIWDSLYDGTRRRLT